MVGILAVPSLGITFVTGIFLFPLAAIIGLNALGRVRASNGTLTGAGFAIAGLIIGVAGIVGEVVYIVLIGVQTHGFQYF